MNIMKSVAIILLSLVLFVPSALADTEDEIVFHGIPWGISVNELTDQLKQRNIAVSNSDINADAAMGIWTYQFRNMSQYDIEATGHKIHLSYWSNPGSVKIAGYPIQGLELFAHYGIDDGIVSFDANDSKYYLAAFSFDVQDEMAVGVYADLFKKLSTLYGTGTEDTTKIIDNTYTYAVWKGANNTAVCLYRSVSTSSNYQFVYLMYGKTDCEQTLREVRRLVIEHEIQSVADDSTGL